MHIIRNITTAAVCFVISASLVAGLAQAEAGNGCTYPQTKLARRTAGSGPGFCKIDHCVASGKRSTTYTIDSNFPFQPVMSAVYTAEWGGNTAFPNCTADVNNGPWE
jgi:hypothetical protein